MNFIYLVRHGENPANISNIFSARKFNYSLTQVGVQQSINTATYFRNKNIHEIFSSPLLRASETAQLIAKRLQLPLRYLESISEIEVGVLEGRKIEGDNFDNYNLIMDNWFFGDRQLSFPAGERYDEITSRIKNALKTVTENRENRNIILVGHSAIFTMLIKTTCQSVDAKWLRNTIIHNCSVTKISVLNCGDQICSELVEWANCNHLSTF